MTTLIKKKNKQDKHYQKISATREGEYLKKHKNDNTRKILGYILILKIKRYHNITL